MKRLYIERFYLNRADNEYPMTVRVMLRIIDKVDEQMLADALTATRRRYPYLCVKLGVVRDAEGSEHFVYDDNPQPWVLSNGGHPVCLFGEEANEHLLAFCWWDDCVALDFSHVLIDGDSAYRLLRTLLYEYCQRRYDSDLSREGVWLAGDTIDEAEWTDPATLPRPAEINPLPLPERPKVINLTTEAVSPFTERKEVVLIRIAEHQLMQQVRVYRATPATFISLAMARAIARLHPDSAPSVPTVCLAVNLRKVMGTPLAHHSMVGGLFLPLGQELKGKSFSEQVKAFREMVTEQTYPDNLQAYFWQTQDRMDMMEKLPTVNARHQAFAQVNTLMGQMASCMLSYVGKAELGAAEQYVKEMVAEADTAYMIVLEASAAGGMFTISFSHQFTNDAYLNAFLDELRGQNLTCEIADRHSLQLASIADYRNNVRRT